MGYKEHFIMSMLFTGITTLLLGAFVYLNNKRNKINITFALYSFSIAWWSLAQIGNVYGPTLEISWFWARVEQMGVVFIPTFFVHFIVVFLSLNKKLLLRFCYVFSTLIAILSPTTSLITPRAERKFNAINFGEPGPLYPLLILFFAISTIYCLWKLFESYKSSAAVQKNRLKYLLGSSILGYIGGSANFFLVYNINLYPLTPFGTYLVSLYTLIVAYAITRHQLLDIEVLIKKSLVFAGMFAFAFGVFVAVTLLVSQLVGGGRIISLAISALIIIIGLRPIESFLINATDKFLFQKKYEYKQVLMAFIDEVITLLSLDEIASSTLKLLDQTIHPASSAVFIYNKLEDKYQLYNSQGLEDKNIAFTSSSKLVIFLKKSKEPVVITQISGIINVSHEILQEMDQLKAMLCLPLMLHHDLIGFIALGKKKSDEEYTKEDLDILLDLARTESVAIGNSQLLAEAAQAERRAAIGTMAAGIYHEIGNPLNIINTKIQLFIISVQRGLYKDKSKEEIIEECKSILNHTINQTNRIADITRKLSNFARPSKEFKPEIVDIPQEIEETLAVVGHELELEKIKIEKQFSSGLPNILADRRQIQQIFFNIIKNAGQAIEEAGVITIKAFTSADNKIHIEITDTGKGIPQDKKDRVFEPFFTTKGQGKGTGLGLSIVKQLVWRNKGDILFRSEAGKGTTFILEFPKAV